MQYYSIGQFFNSIEWKQLNTHVLEYYTDCLHMRALLWWVVRCSATRIYGALPVSARLPVSRLMPQTAGLTTAAGGDGSQEGGGADGTVV